LKAGVLGLNYLEMVGADPEAAMAAIADDEFSAFNDGRPLEAWGTARRRESPELFA
jgi:hypothetical protein